MGGGGVDAAMMATAWGELDLSFLLFNSPPLHTHRLRVFHTHAPTYAAAVFVCTDGIVNLSAAVAVLVSEGGTFKLVDVDDVMFDLASLVRRAKLAWFQPGHPGWDLVTCAGGRTFNSVRELRSYMTEQVVESAPMLL